MQQSSVCRAAKVRLLHGKNGSAGQQISGSDRQKCFDSVNMKMYGENNKKKGKNRKRNNPLHLRTVRPNAP
ncbi:MAG: hypothetical protein IJ417_05305, partial [Bacteroidaceae bacterium]|nr:hypothetical protein [Bacteroidaceae bacterium]